MGTLGDLQYSYDAAGNRIATGGSFARTLVPDAVSTSTYDAGNRQLAFGSSTQTFDDNGNLLTRTDPSGTLTYTWDARNRLAALSGPSLNASFAYDGLGRRAQKTINSVLTQFLYDGLDAVKESNGGNDGTYLRTLSIDEALARTDAGGTVHVLGDALGSSVALTAPGGTAATTYTYEPFGRTETAGTPNPNPFRFTGREDDGTGLYYYRARYYDPGRGRFVSEDPIGLAGGVNAYAYGANSPANWIDPQGTWIIPAAAIAVSASVPVLVLYLINKCMDTCKQENPCDDLEDPSRGANIKKCLDRCMFGLEFLGWHSPKGSAVKAGSKAGQAVGRAVSGE